MQTEEKTAPIATQPEIYASAGRYYIMNRRSENTDEPPTASAEEPPAENPDLCRRIRNKHREYNYVGYLVCGLLGIAAGAAVALVYPMDGMSISTENSTLLSLFSGRFIQCALFLLAEYILGYFAAGSVIVWILPLLYGLGAGLCAANSAITGQPLVAALHILYTAVICFAAARSAGFSSLLLSIVSGRSGSVITDGTSGVSFDLKFVFYLALTTTAALAEAILLTI